MKNLAKEVRQIGMTLAAASLLLLGCGSGGSSGGTGTIAGSCVDVVKASCGGNSANGSCTYCTDYSGTAVTSSSVQSTCAITNGIGGNTTTYSSSPCPTANRVGSCVSSLGDTAETTEVRYYSPGFSNSAKPPAGTQSAPASCKSVAGTYTPG